VLVSQFNPETATASFRLACELRDAGLRVDLYPDGDRYGKQFKYAEERGIRFVALLSPRELEAGVIAVKDIVSGAQVDVPAGEIVGWLQRSVE
jgi:histidyl-tRNA synthetase